MFAYIVRRVLQGLLVIFLVTTFTFGLMQLAPGDPINILVGEAEISEEQIDVIREKWGLDRPWYIQYFTWLSNVAQGDMGKSVIRTSVPVHEMVFEAAWATLKLNFFAISLALLLAIPAGMIAAIKRYSIFDSATMIWASAGVALPNFWVGLMLIIVFSLTLGWFPSFGSGSAKHFVLPVLVLAINETALITRIMRGSMLEVLNQDYMSTARAKGLKETVVITRHAARNALLPIVTVVGVRLAFLLSGTIVVETVFGWPGLGSLFVNSIVRLDYQVVQAIVLLLAIIVVVANIVTDLTYAFIDPRIRLR